MARYIGLQLVAGGESPKVVNALQAATIDDLFTQIAEKAPNEGAYWDKYLVVGGEMFHIEPTPAKAVQHAYESY